MSQQIDRTLDILELLIENPEGLALGEVALQLGLPKSATHRLVSQLVERGYMERDAASQRYRLTMRLSVLGFRFLSKTGLTDICQPELDELAARTGELARIAMVDGDTMTWVAQAQGARYGLRYDGNLGRHVVQPATASGKARLATMSDDRAVGIVASLGFGDRAELGQNAISSMAELLKELETTRKRGYGIAYEEGEPGIAAVAAAIPASNPAEDCVGTVSVAGPITRQTRQRLDEIAPDVVNVAKRLSELWPIRRYQPLAPNPDSFHNVRKSA
ncbi:IclR family transcriptional regulator [Microbaculum marinum]|uniref:IclR family transcriptional regulator n=1 Tax=Microbaculum marinum TaxID=1764581 RepID=A0AAW9RIC0_9HYPH